MNFESFTELAKSIKTINPNNLGKLNIAIGTARLFGFHLMQNFASPFFSRNVAEF